MDDRHDGTAEGQTETLQAGPSRPSLFSSVPAGWRRRSVAPIAFVLGVAAGAGAAMSWQPQPTPPRTFRPDEHAVELLLLEAAPLPSKPGRTRSGSDPLQIDAALLLSGAVTSTVTRIETLGDGDGLELHAPTLPVTVSPTDRFRSVYLRLSIRDCHTAVLWSPSDRPFLINWRDEFDRTHADRGGDFGRHFPGALTRYIDAVCDDP